MAYTPTVWVTGDVITAVKLNKAENGIAAASVAELPSVSDTDEGKVLTVDSSGDWVAAASHVVLSVTIDNEDTLHLGKSWDDLKGLSGIPVFAQFDISETDQNRYFLARLYADNGSYFAAFVSADANRQPAIVTFSAVTASAELVVVD